MGKSGRWFRFHLSTLMVVSVAASVLLWANVVETPTHFDKGYYEYLFCRGWPYMFSGTADDERIRVFFYWQDLLIDVAITILILSAVAAVCEWMIRRKKYG